TVDDIRPYNGFLQQQTTLKWDGTPLWKTPDAVADPTISTSQAVGNDIDVTVGIVNDGDAALGFPVYVTLYDQKTDTVITTVESAIQIFKGDTGYVTIPVSMDSYPVVNVLARVNDRGTMSIYQPECDSLDNEISMILFSPMLSNRMKKDATLLPSTVANNGAYPNPVSILYNEVLEYKITAVNANLSPGTLIIRDTLPAYLRYVAGTADSPSLYPFTIDDNGTIPGPPERDTIVWTFTGVHSLDTVEATFRATPASGVSASQPMFVNRAWVTVSDSIKVPTNGTYHQGAGVSTVTFSASVGGEICNETPQALDFRTSPRNGVLVVPDEGYRFAGWSHGEYTSLRGERIEARSGIMLYDTLVIYGNVELRAGFVPEEYPVRYHLNGGENASGNPAAYTVESGAIILEAPRKTDDVFTGWTGSNGDDPQTEVVIPHGSTGELEYYANYLYSGREDAIRKRVEETDKIWASGAEAFIRTSRPGSIARIYTPDGVLRELRTLLSAGTAKIGLAPGVYIVTLNNSAGQKIIIK
ncbi:MAG: InlB B-repeat-containing protein, partial [Tannerella sp.]|nr:InlB B-repeat-containing protein [Tannerella sp.]